MIPYGLLFYTIFLSDIKKYKGIWQDWLCMQIENGVEIEPWMMCFAENPIVYDTFLDTRLEQEKKAFTGGRAEFYFFAAGFAWKMFAEKNVSLNEIRSVIISYDEDMGTEAYHYINDPEKYDKILEEEVEYFNKHIWDNIPKETQKLFYC